MECNTKKTFKCDKCDQVFSQRYHLNLHHEEVHVGVKHNCDKCDASYTRRRSLLSHKMRKHLGVNFRCHVCNRQFASENSVRRHVRFHHKKDETFKCKVCSKLFHDNHGLRTHIADVHLKERPHRCDKCDRRFAQKHYLQKHYRRKHDRAGKLLARDFCTQKFTDHMTRATHIVEEHGDQVFNTEIPAKESARQDTEVVAASAFKSVKDDGSSVNIQNSTDNENRDRNSQALFKCVMCDKVLPSKIRLNIHMGSAHGVNPFKCDFCARFFALESRRAKHVKKCHTGKESASFAKEGDIHPYKCGICKMAFSSPQDLKDHVDIIHMSSKNEETKEAVPVGCIDESVTFVTKQEPKLALFPRVLLPKLEIIQVNPGNNKSKIGSFNSKTHKKSSLVCDRCGKGFSSKQAMELHIRTVHLGQRAYKCDLCDKRFTQRTSLRHHINAI